MSGNSDPSVYRSDFSDRDIAIIDYVVEFLESLSASRRDELEVEVAEKRGVTVEALAAEALVRGMKDKGLLGPEAPPPDPPRKRSPRRKQLSLTIPPHSPWYKRAVENLDSPASHAAGEDCPIEKLASLLTPSGDPGTARPMKTVAFVNKKGGVGKSSCVMHLGGILASRGVRTLLVDADPQASLSQGLLGPRETLEMDPMSTLAALYEPGSPLTIRDIIQEVGRPNLGLVVGHDRMTDVNHPKPWERGLEQFILRDALATVADDWDVCLIDCPPHIQACAWAGLVAADGVVIPAQLEDYGVQGITMIQDSIDRARSLANPGLTLLGFLPSMVQKTLTIHTNYDADLRAAYGDDVFTAVVPAAKDFKEAVTLRRSVIEYKPKSAASKAAEAVADEMMARLADRCGGAGEPTLVGIEERGAA
jgi:chromosome partitioning protein